MSQTFTSHLSYQSDALSEVLACHRRVCVLHHQGRVAEAKSLRTSKLSPELEALQLKHPEHCDEIARQLEFQTQRVEEAAIMAALIAELLPSRILLRETPVASSPASARTTAPLRRADRPSDENAVAGFIDEMLAAQSTSRKS